GVVLVTHGHDLGGLHVLGQLVGGGALDERLVAQAGGVVPRRGDDVARQVVLALRALLDRQQNPAAVAGALAERPVLGQAAQARRRAAVVHVPAGGVDHGVVQGGLDVHDHAVVAIVGAVRHRDVVDLGTGDHGHAVVPATP